ncbi:MAG TPA: hypothetical protein VFO80_04860 [Sphingomonas sp.]|nr:hypothetical protein [Sphingomonas sp.]
MRSDASWLTTTNLVLIAIGIVLAVMVILHGARLKRRRQQVDTAIGDRPDGAPEPAPAAALDETPPPAPETTPVAVAPAPAPVEVAPAPTPAPAALPVAPPPPPLAGDDTPVVATAAPFDPAPATIAADLATPPSDPAPDAAATTGRDDLTRLKGVGPKLAARLNELGVTTYAQIAALSPSDAATLDAQLGSFQGRMIRDRWVEQAGYLAKDDRAGFEAAFGKL